MRITCKKLRTILVELLNSSKAAEDRNGLVEFFFFQLLSVYL